jgi:serine protease inhibitor
VSLPYKGGDFVMEIILPSKGSFADLENAFSSDILIESRKDSSEKKVSLFLPKFKIEESMLDLT